MNLDDPIPPSIATHGDMIEIPDSPQAEKRLERPADGSSEQTKSTFEGPTPTSVAEVPSATVEGPTPTSVAEVPKAPVEGPTPTSGAEPPKGTQDPDVEMLIGEEVGDKNQPTLTKIDKHVAMCLVSDVTKRIKILYWVIRGGKFEIYTTVFTIL